MRGLKKVDIKGFMITLEHTRSTGHQDSSRTSGIKIVGENKWIRLIQNIKSKLN